MKSARLQRRLYLAAAAILLAGLGSAFAIYLAAEDTAPSDLVIEFESSKAYRHELELYGGKLNVLASDLMAWFDGLWHGRALAFTVAAITVAVAAGVFLVAHQLPFLHGADEQDEDHGPQRHP